MLPSPLDAILFYAALGVAAGGRLELGHVNGRWLRRAVKRWPPRARA